MDTIKKRNRIVLCLCSIFLLFASIFSFILFAKDTHMVFASSEGNTTAYYTYSSSDYQLGLSFCTAQDLSTLEMSFEYGRFDFTFSNDPSTSDLSDNDLFTYSFKIHVSNYSSGTGFLDFSDTVSFTTFDIARFVWLKIGTKYIPCEVYCSSNFDFYPVELTIGNQWNSDLHIGYNKFIYKDISGDEFRIYTGYYNNGGILTEGLVLSDRTYYLSNSFNDDDLYNIGYNTGKQEGYYNGYNTGKNDGFNNGYNTGKNDGYNLGYNTALENDQYTFTNLISAVIDVPVRTFTSLFNFEILGVNLSGFFLGLLTCCIVVGVIRLIL